MYCVVVVFVVVDWSCVVYSIILYYYIKDSTNVFQSLSYSMKTTTSSAGAFKVVKKMKTQAVQKKNRAADLTLLVEHSTGHIDDGGGESEENDDDEEDEENLSQVIWNKPHFILNFGLL